MPYSSHGTQPQITNITFTSNEELSHVFRDNVKKFDVASRNKKDFTVSYISEGHIKTIDGSSSYFEDFVLGPITLYIKVPSATSIDPEVIEILEWISAD